MAPSSRTSYQHSQSQGPMNYIRPCLSVSLISPGMSVCLIGPRLSMSRVESSRVQSWLNRVYLFTMGSVIRINSCFRPSIVLAERRVWILTVDGSSYRDHQLLAAWHSLSHDTNSLSYRHLSAIAPLGYSLPPSPPICRTIQGDHAASCRHYLYAHSCRTEFCMFDERLAWYGSSAMFHLLAVVFSSKGLMPFLVWLWFERVSWYCGVIRPCLTDQWFVESMMVS